MENTPTVCADELPTILGIKKKNNIEKCQLFFQRLDFAPNNIQNVESVLVTSDNFLVNFP